MNLALIFDSWQELFLNLLESSTQRKKKETFQTEILLLDWVLNNFPENII